MHMRSWTELDHFTMMACRSANGGPRSVEEGDELDTIFRSSAATAPPAADVVHDHAARIRRCGLLCSQLLRSLRGRRSWLAGQS